MPPVPLDVAVVDVSEDEVAETVLDAASLKPTSSSEQDAVPRAVAAKIERIPRGKKDREANMLGSDGHGAAASTNPREFPPFTALSGRTSSSIRGNRCARVGPMQRSKMAGEIGREIPWRGRTALIACGFWALTACNAVFGIEEGSLAEGVGGATSSSTSVTSTTLSSTTSGVSSTTSGTGGAGGTCNFYDGYADLHAVGDGSTGFTEVVVVAGQSIGGYFVANDGTSLFSIGGGQIPPYCAVGIELYLAGSPKVGTYNAVAVAPYEDLSAFKSGDNAFSRFRLSADTLPCDDEPGEANWRSISGTFEVISVDQGTVILEAHDVVHAPDPTTPTAMGEVTMNGSLNDICFTP